MNTICGISPTITELSVVGDGDGIGDDPRYFPYRIRVSVGDGFGDGPPISPHPSPYKGRAVIVAVMK